MSSPNPFLTAAALDAPLPLELCQELHARAVWQAIVGRSDESIPDTVPVAQLRHWLHWYGRGCVIFEPEVVRQTFAGVTLALYRAIEDLYCRRWRRSARMVWRMLQAMARHATKPEISYEAVWALCVHLAKKREATTVVTQTSCTAPWWIGSLRPPVLLQTPGQDSYHPALVCVLGMDPPRVLAFRIVRPEAVEGAIPLVLYDALISQRQPARDGAAGLRWPWPTHLLSDAAITEHCRQSCEALALSIQRFDGDLPPLLGTLNTFWKQTPADRILSEEHFALQIDTFLAKQHGYGPLRMQQELDRKFAQLLGYNREPVEQFPSLVHLLPRVSGRIGADGSIAFDGLHYTDDLLLYWLGQEITLCQSPTAEAVAWIYLDGEFLCQAHARELQRQDGTYRPNRPRR